MPADEVTRGTDVEASRARTGPRHAAPKKPLFTRFHMPAGKAIALAAMPTAVLMGMGFTPTLALADGNDTAPPSNSLTADEYKDCLAAVEGAAKGSPSPTSSPSATEGADGDEAGDEAGTKEPSPSASGDAGEGAGKDTAEDTAGEADSASSPDSGSGGKAADAPAAPPAPQSEEKPPAAGTTPSPSAGEDRNVLGDGNVLKDLGDAVEGIFTGGEKGEETPSPTPTPSAPESGGTGTVKDAADETPGTAEGTARDTADAAEETAGGTGGTADKAAGAAEEAAKEAKEEAEEKEEATASPGPTPSASESAGVDPEDCPVATDAEGGVDNKVLLPDDPWQLNASSLLLKGASYKGVVQVRTADGSTKKVLKYVVSGGTDIGDLHQTVKDEQIGRTYHVQAAEGSTSTIRDGETIMYTESISGNLLGLIPVTFDPEHPPPLDIPLIYFTKVTVVQAGQFGGTLHIPGLHQYTT
ncbi:hypothetical protein ABZ023_00065 [Streptomyces sp. NPDC006367]|uniref:hypothetical protein n=1 Tax=unclassified Streptomyces TaxID=2593676 RepID=UPI0033A1BEBA